MTNEEKVKTLKASDLTISENLKRESNVAPAGSILVNLSSNGQLGFPASVHVRDYSFDDAVALSEMDEDRQYSIILPVLKNLICEDVDMTKITLPDIMEILMSILGSWYSLTIEELQYYVNDKLTGDKLNAKENISKASIPIANIKTKMIDKEARAPITLQKKGGIKVVIDIPRPSAEIASRSLLNERDIDLLNEISDKKDLQRSSLASERKIYEDLENKKTLALMRYINACSILEVDGKKMETIGEKLDSLKLIPLSYWSAYSNVFMNRFNYGIQPDVKFRCTVTNKMITRSFSFRISTFIPTMDKTGGTGFDITLG